MKLSNPTADQAIIIARGKSVALDSFSRSLPTDDLKASTLLKSFSNDCGPTFRAFSLLHQDTQFFIATNINGTLTAKLLTGPQLDPNDEDFVLASASDALGQATPVRLTSELFLASFTSLVRQGDVVSSSLSHIDAAPDTISGPPDDNGVSAEPSMARLHWPDSQDDSDSPQIAAFNLLFPVPPGLAVQASFPMKDPIYPDDPAFATLKAWQHAFCYAIEHNDGHSVTMGGPLFDPASFDGDNSFSNLPIKDNLLPTPGDFRTLCSMEHSRQHDLVSDNIKALTNGVYYLAGVTVPQAAVAPGTGVPPKIEVTAVIEPREHSTKADKEQHAHAQSVIAKWEIAFGSLDSDTGVFTPAVASESFKDILRQSNKTIALRNMQEHTETATRAALSSDTKLAAYVCLEPEHITSGFLTCIRNFQVFTDFPMTALPKFQTNFSLANLLPLEKASIVYQRVCIDEVQQLFRGEYTTADTKDQARGSLYFGRLSSVDDTIKMCANFMTLFKHFFPTFAASLCYKHMKEFIDLLLTAPVKKWLDTFETANPAIPHNIMQEMVLIVGSFFKVGNHPDNVRAYTSGEHLPATAFMPAKLACEGTQRRLLDVVTISRPGVYADPPTELVTFLSGKSSPGSGLKRSADTNSTDAKKSKSAIKDKPTNKSKPTPKSGPKGSHPDDTKGILLWAGEGPTPKFTNIRAKKTLTSQKAEQLCTFYMTQGWHCNRADCPRPHITSLNQLEDGPRKKLIDFVASPTNLYSWAPGKGPQG